MAETQESKQIAMMKQMMALAEKQTAYFVQRSEMSGVHSCQNAEPTLSIWVRTALALMICGLAIDRFGLMLDGSPVAAHVTPARGLLLDRVSQWTSIGLVPLGVALVMATGCVFWPMRERGNGSVNRRPIMAPIWRRFFEAMVALFGIVRLAIMTTAMA